MRGSFVAEDAFHGFITVAPLKIHSSSLQPRPDGAACCSLVAQTPGQKGAIIPTSSDLGHGGQTEFQVNLKLGLTAAALASDATNPIAQEVAPAGSLSLFDLGYFCLDRFQNLTRAGAFWISRLQHGTSVFDAQGQPLALLQYLRQQTGSGPIDVSVLLGVSHRLPCRLIALRVPQEVADRRRQKAYVKAQKHGRVPSREYLEWQDWTIFVTNCEPELLTWEAVVVLYRAVADRTYVQTLEIAQPARDTPRRRDRGGAVGGGLRQVDHRACATLDPPDRDLVRVPPQPDEGRSNHRRLGYVADRRLGRPRPTHCGLESHEGRPP